MAYRTFVDPEGRSWQVWEVRPTGMERRRGDRRTRVLPFSTERRSGQDRRTVRQPRAFLNEYLAQGWLAFHSATERRRLSPIPEGWEEVSAAELAEFCDRADPVPRGWSAPSDRVLKRPA
jgi:hypothetical protein